MGKKTADLFDNFVWRSYLASKKLHKHKLEFLFMRLLQ